MEFTLENIVAGINARKDELGVSPQQIADASGVSRATVDRILKRQDGYVPHLENLLDVANAVGYQFNFQEPVPIQTDDLTLQQIIYVYEKRCEALEKESRLKTVQSNLIIAAKDKALESKDLWLNRFFKTIVALGSGIILVLLADVCIRGAGWIP